MIMMWWNPEPGYWKTSGDPDIVPVFEIEKPGRGPYKLYSDGRHHTRGRRFEGGFDTLYAAQTAALRLNKGGLA